MTFHQPANYNWRSMLSLIKESHLQQIQNWIRKEIVDDDPNDTETFFPELISNLHADASKQELN